MHTGDVIAMGSLWAPLVLAIIPLRPSWSGHAGVVVMVEWWKGFYNLFSRVGNPDESALKTTSNYMFSAALHTLNTKWCAMCAVW
jgi:hypothetical protein